jgi:hypothetical protein
MNSRPNTVPARDACCEQLPTDALVETQAVRHPVRQTRAHLHGSALSTGAPPEEVREHGADKHHRRHPQWNLGPLVVDRIDDEVVAPLDGQPEAFVDPANPEARDR